MSNNVKNIVLKIELLSLLIVVGCGKYDGLFERQSHIEQYQEQLGQKTNEVLSAKESFGLNDCIEVALANNLNVRSSEIQQRIAKLERKVAFSNFLPTVNLNYQYTRWNKQPKVKFSSSVTAMHDQRVREITWQIQMNIFDPSTWFLYAMHQRGEEITEIVTKYIRQMTVLEVTVNYYHCLSLKQIEHALQSQLNAAVALEKEISNLYEEGMVTQWQAEQAKVLVLDKDTTLGSVQYAIKQAEADLLVSMGLSPLADISLDIEQSLEVPDRPLEDLITDALISSPQLYIADRNIAIEKEKVKIALAGFLPRLVGFANRTHSSDSFLLYDNFWTYGLAGTMSVFNGFATINEYKAAKERRKDAFIEREQQTLVLMLEVAKAYLNLEDAKRQSLLAQKAFNASSMHLNEVQEKWREGLADSSKMLDVMAQRDAAQTELTNSHFQLQVSIATLYNVMGVTDIGYEENKNENDVAKNN
jgi:outer membrane protein TolC